MSMRKFYLALVFLVVAALVIGGVSCAQPAPSPTPSPSPSPSPKPSPSPSPSPSPAPSPSPSPTAAAKETPKQMRYLSASVGTQNFGMQAYGMGEVQKVMKIPAGAFPGGPEFNIPVLARGEAEFSYVNPQFTYLGYNGLAPFKEKYSNLRWVNSFGAVVCTPVVLNESPIKSITDLNGKKVGLSHKGSGAELLALAVMAEAGITQETIQKAGGVTTNLAYGAIADALMNRTLDAAWFMSPVDAPHESLILAEQRFGLRILDIPQAALDSLYKKTPYYSPLPVKAGVYKGTPKSVTLPGDPWGTITRANIADDFIYKFLEVIYQDDVAKRSRTDWPMWNHHGELDTSLWGANTIPMHPGAAKFFLDKFKVDVKTKGIEVKP
ncbi:MAG: TAXI family TRAP transporter solute-binding subunit [Chloroflexota bacterium]